MERKEADTTTTTMLNTRIPDVWVIAIDAKAKELEAATGATYNRTSVVRMALARFLGLVDTTTDSTLQPTP